MAGHHVPNKKSQHNNKLSAFIGGLRNPLKRKSSTPAQAQTRSVPRQEDVAQAHGAFPQSTPMETTTIALAPPPPKEKAAIAVSSGPQHLLQTVVSREVEDDVSTLQDPYVGVWGNIDTIPEPPADNTVDGSMVSSEHRGYVWAVGRERLNTGGGSSATVITAGTGAYMSDDQTYEQTYGNGYENEEGYHERGGGGASSFERFTVVAPAGKLGIVVDNQSGDMPTIVGVKETSVLHGRLRSDDVLLSMDEVDCRGMSAVQVSKLISHRSHNPTRTFVLGRSTVVRC